SAAEIGMQDDASSIDDRPQRKLHRAVQVAGDGLSQVGHGELHGFLRGQNVRADLIAQSGDYRADRFGYRSLPFAGQERRQIGGLQQVIDRGKKAEKFGFGSGRHVLLSRTRKRVREPFCYKDSQGSASYSLMLQSLFLRYPNVQQIPRG